MILYLDTSAVVKLFIHENGTEYLQGLLAPAGVFAVSKLCQPEFLAALAKSVRMGICPAAAAEETRREFHQVWDSIIKVEVDGVILERASDLAWTHGLRGYDAVHLASAMHLENLSRNTVNMVTYDRQLWEVSTKVGMVTLPERL